MRGWTLLAVTLLFAGCAELYESGSPTPIECEAVPPEENPYSEADPPNPILCERAGENASAGSSANESSAPR